MGTLERLGEFVAGYRPDARTRVAVRLHVADTIGARIAGTATAEGRALTRLRGDRPAALTDDIAIACAATRLSEVDDIHLGAMITPGAIVVPAALAIAASRPDVAADDVAAAIVAGYEAMVRLGVAIDGPSVLYRGIWPSYFAAPFGVAAVAARLFRFDAVQAANALSAALIMASPGTGHHAAQTTVRWLAVGQAAARGLQAAMAIQTGFTSNLNIVDGEFFKGIYGIEPRLDVLADGWSEPALHQVSFKPWCAARQTMAATQALKDLIADGLKAEAITAIEAAVLPPHLKMIGHGVAAGDRFSHLTSAPYNMAVAALAPEAAYEIAGPAGSVSPQIEALMARITVRADDSLLAGGYPRSWPAHVTVMTASGRQDRRVDHVPGDPAWPYGEAEVKTKFSRLVAPVLGVARAEILFAHALDAVEQPTKAISELVAAESR